MYQGFGGRTGARDGRRPIPPRVDQASDGGDFGAVGAVGVPAAVLVAPGGVAPGLEPVVVATHRAGVGRAGGAVVEPGHGVVDLAVGKPASRNRAQTSTQPIEPPAGLRCAATGSRGTLRRRSAVPRVGRGRRRVSAGPSFDAGAAYRGADGPRPSSGRGQSLLRIRGVSAPSWPGGRIASGCTGRDGWSSARRDALLALEQVAGVVRRLDVDQALEVLGVVLLQAGPACSRFGKFW